MSNPLAPFTPKVKLLGPMPPEWFAAQCDGCTMSPDGIWRDACVVHDWHYSPSVDCSRWQADAWFLRNLMRCGCPGSLALRYWAAVRLCGWRHFER